MRARRVRWRTSNKPAFGTQIKGQDVIIGSDVVGQGLQDTAGICDEDTWTEGELAESRTSGIEIATRNRVERANFVHIGERKDELVVYGDASADETGVSALGHDGNASLCAPFDNLADLEGGLWLENGGSMATVLSHPVIIVVFEV
jgi:hypothetical protein